MRHISTTDSPVKRAEYMVFLVECWGLEGALARSFDTQGEWPFAGVVQDLTTLLRQLAGDLRAKDPKENKETAISVALPLVRYADVATFLLMAIAAATQEISDAKNLLTDTEFGRLFLVQIVSRSPIPGVKEGTFLVGKLSLPLPYIRAHEQCLKSLTDLCTESGESQRILLKLLNGQRLQSFSAPLLFAPYFLRVINNGDLDIEEKITSVGGLFDLVAEHRLYLDGDNGDDIFGIFYNLLTPALMVSPQREKALSCLALLAKILTKRQAVLFIKRALIVAMFVPAHASVWLMHFAGLIFNKNHDFCLPLVHINPIYAKDLKMTNPEFTALLEETVMGKLSDAMKFFDYIEKNTERAAHFTDEDYTALIVANFSLLELNALKSHTDKTVRAAADALIADAMTRKGSSEWQKKLDTLMGLSLDDMLSTSLQTTLLRYARDAANVDLL